MTTLFKAYGLFSFILWPFSQRPLTLRPLNWLILVQISISQLSPNKACWVNHLKCLQLLVWPVYGPFGIEIFRKLKMTLKWLKMLENTFSETPWDLWNRFLIEKFDFFHGFYEKLSKIEIYPNLLVRLRASPSGPRNLLSAMVAIEKRELSIIIFLFSANAPLWMTHLLLFSPSWPNEQS